MPDIFGICCMVEVVVGPVVLGLSYRALEVEGCGLLGGVPDGGSCPCMGNAARIVPPSGPFGVRDPFGGEGVPAGLFDSVIEWFEGCVDRAPLIIVILSGGAWRCAMFGSIWQARGNNIANSFIHASLCSSSAW